MKPEVERHLKRIYKRRKRQFLQKFKDLTREAHDLGLDEIKEEMEKLREKVVEKCLDLPRVEEDER